MKTWHYGFIDDQHPAFAVFPEGGIVFSLIEDEDGIILDGTFDEFAAFANTEDAQFYADILNTFRDR
jgi:hypothetical protein